MTDQTEPAPGEPWGESTPPDDFGRGDEALGRIPVEQLALIRVLWVAHEHRLDLPPAIRALAEESPPARRQPLQELADGVSIGMPLIDALEQVPGLLDRSTVVALRLASQTGTLPAMYRAILRSSEQPPSAPPVGLRSRGAQLLAAAVGLLVLTLVVSFQATFIFPTYRAIAEEMLPMGVEGVMPPTIDFFLRHNHWWPLLSIAAVALAIALYLTDSAGWSPWRGRKRRREHHDSVDLLSLLAIVLGSGRPVAAGLATLARFHHVPSTRRRLLAVCQAIERGSDPWQSLARERLLSPRESQALAAAPSETTQTWLLGWLATSRRDRRLSRSHLSGQLLTLTVILAFAAIVALLVSGTFQMLANLIQALA